MIPEILPNSIEKSTDSSFTEKIVLIRTKLGRIATALLLVTSGTIATFSVEESVNPISAHAETLGYPNPDMPCEHSPYNSTGTCANYDWGPLHTEKYDDPSEYSSRGYAYRNCTDYVAWKESTKGVTVPHNLGNGGKWFDNAPLYERSTTPKTWDAAVVPGEVGHVAFVESINSDGTITVSEYNHNAMGTGDIRTGRASAMGFTEFVDFGAHPTTQSSNNRLSVPGDFNGDGVTDAAVFRPSDGMWHIRGVGDYYYGQSGDIPVPADYRGDHITNIAIYRPSEGVWHIRGLGDYAYGQNGDIPVPGDYNGDGKADIAVYRPSDGYWHIRGVGDFQYGIPGDIPVPGYYSNDNSLDIAIYRPREGGWHIRGVGDFPYGWSTDIPVQGDYNGDGITDAAIYRPSEGGWHLRGVGDFPYGWSTDVPVPANYNNDKITDAAIYRPSEGGWHLRGVGDFPYGWSTDIPAVQTLNAYLLKQYGLIPGY